MKIISGIRPKAIKAVVYGPEGIGKTTFASQFPDPLFIDTEGSTAFIDVRRFAKPASWPNLLDQVKYVHDTVGVCKTLVIDTADWAERLCVQCICDKYNKDGLEGFDYGRGYTYVYEAFGRLLNLLTEVNEQGIHTVLTAHASMTRCEQPEEFGTFDRWELKLINSPKCSVSKMVKEWSDILLFANYKTLLVKDDKTKKNKAQGGKRMMYTTHHPCWDAKNRHGLADELPFDFSEIAPCLGSPSANGAAATAPAQKREPPAPGAAAQPSASTAAQTPSPEPQTSGQIAMDIAAKQETGAPDRFTDVDRREPLPLELPEALRGLMENNNVTEAEIRLVVSEKGYFPLDMPVKDYPHDFIQGVLIGAWEQVFQMIRDERQVPF